ncbi:MAG: GH39 family glycosyl hydrolase [Solirubrobacteraceae bacterium]
MNTANSRPTRTRALALLLLALIGSALLHSTAAFAYSPHRHHHALRISHISHTPSSRARRTTVGAPSPAPPGPVLGFNTYTSARTILEQRKVGATVSRLFVDWAAVEPSRGSWNFQQTDSEYSQMLAGGLRPLIVAFTAPCWARPSTDCSNPYFTGPPDPAYDADWVSYIKALTTRYPAAAGIEVWNEPNLDQSFLPRANPDRYTHLLNEAYGAIRSVNPTMPVISGGLLLSPAVAGSGAVTGGYGAAQFLATMYADHAKLTALGVHIYPSDYVNGTPAAWDPIAMQSWLTLINTVRLRDGHASQPMWITEMGVSTGTQAGWAAAATPAQQAADLGRMIATAKATPAIRAVIIQGLEDEAANPADPYNGVMSGWGIFDSGGTPKPAACAVSLAFIGTLSCGG